MGSSVKTNKMPLAAHHLFIDALKRLPQRVLWKQDGDQNMTDIPSNIRLYKWLPQQDLLGKTYETLPKNVHNTTYLGIITYFNYSLSF